MLKRTIFIGITLVIITAIWQGYEYFVEGQIEPNLFDSIVAFVLAIQIRYIWEQREIILLQEKLIEKQKDVIAKYKSKIIEYTDKINQAYQIVKRHQAKKLQERDED